MNNAPIVLRDEVIQHLQENEKLDSTTLALRKSPFDDVPMRVIVQQVVGRQVARQKFPFLRSHPQYIYPKKVSLEQSTSQVLAEFKASLVTGKKMIDLTGGMGIDLFFIGKKYDERTYLDPDKTLAQIVKHNFRILDFKCNVICKKCEDFLSQDNSSYDLIYIDPSRRVDGTKNTSIHNHTPNIVELQHTMRSRAKMIMIKLSPMQDIHECIRLISNIHKIYILAFKNEVKELLLMVDSAKACEDPLLCTEDIGYNFSYSAPMSRTITSVGCALPQKYIYQPSATITKAGLQDYHASTFGICKIHPNTQLFTSDEMHGDYQGRVFEVVAISEINKKKVKRHLPDGKANVIAKNLPLSPSQLSKKLALTDGGDWFVIGFTQYDDDKRVAICRRIGK